jgi:hypothetical protein
MSHKHSGSRKGVSVHVFKYAIDDDQMRQSIQSITVNRNAIFFFFVKQISHTYTHRTKLQIFQAFLIL